MLVWIERESSTVPARLGVVVPKKIAARSVDRARCKRLMREAFRNARPRWQGVDVVVRVTRRPPRGEALESGLRRDLEQFFGRPLPRRVDMPA
jgi:ribonuclease P protein component